MHSEEHEKIADFLSNALFTCIDDLLTPGARDCQVQVSSWLLLFKELHSMYITVSSYAKRTDEEEDVDSGAGTLLFSSAVVMALDEVKGLVIRSLVAAGDFSITSSAEVKVLLVGLT
ncbi:hypothetical protein Ancab_038754 [Ancistrocladus abbreviatus]